MAYRKPVRYRYLSRNSTKKLTDDRPKMRPKIGFVMLPAALVSTGQEIVHAAQDSILLGITG
jgi:hypothetical protein